MRTPILAASLIAGLLTLGGAVQPAHAQEVQVNNGNRTIAVTATQSAERRADTATLHIGYQLYGATSDAVNRQAADTSAAIVKAVESIGIAQDAIQSENQSTGPVEGYQENGLTPEEKAQRQFQAQQSWTVRTSPAEVAKVLAAAVGAGANQSGNIEWNVSDEASLTAEAAAKALVQSRQIAAQMAAGLGVKVGNLLYASNEVQQVRVMAGQPMELRVASGQGFGSGPAPLSLTAPMISRSATVTAIFTVQ